MGKPETDVIKREILFNNTLYLYLPDKWIDYFKKPKYTLLLGRSSDLATVESIEHIKLIPKENSPLRGTIVPLYTGLPGIVHALPVEFDYSTIPRVPKIVKPFIIIPFHRKTIYPEKLRFDEELELGVFLYESRMFS